MEAAMVELSAGESRERLLAFVDGVVRRLPHVRQRENALLYVRGLIEQGGRKSLQPTLFRLEETPARYESVQQFLADSPWEPELLVRACAERVATEIGVLAWVVDDTGIVEFRATYLHQRDLQVLHERSRFVREAGRWYYLDAVATVL